ERSGDEISGNLQLFLKLLCGVVLFERRMHLGYLQHLIVVEKNAHQRKMRVSRNQRRQSDQAWNRRLLDRDILRVQLEQAHAAGQQNADDPDQRKKIRLVPVCFLYDEKIVRAVNDREGQRHDQAVDRAQINILAELGQDQCRNDDVE